MISYRIRHNQHSPPRVFPGHDRPADHFLHERSAARWPDQGPQRTHVYACVETAARAVPGATIGCQCQISFLEFMHLNHQVCVRLVSVFVKDWPKEL